MNRYPENQDVFNRSKLVPGEFSSTSTVKSTRLHLGKQNHIIIFGDNIFHRIHVREFDNENQKWLCKIQNFLRFRLQRNLTLTVNPTLVSGLSSSAF